MVAFGTRAEISSSAVAMSGDENLNGLGGWLILVRVGVVFAPVLLLFESVPSYFSLFIDGSWSALTEVGGRHYHSGWKPILLGGMILDALLFCALCYLAFLFFCSKRTFPKWFILLLVAKIALPFADAIFVKAAFADDPYILAKIPGPVDGDLVLAIVAAAIWIPYTLVSKRVEATFVL